MGYFSMQDSDYEDFSYPSPERQLKMRLYDLKVRLQELSEKGALYINYNYISDDDIRYVLPESFNCIYHVERAIQLAIQDLFDKYGIVLTENGYMEIDDLRQMTIYEYRNGIILLETEAA